MRARLFAISSALVLALFVSACGHKQASLHVADANNIGGYVDAGPITYQMQISRIERGALAVLREVAAPA